MLPLSLMAPPDPPKRRYINLDNPKLGYFVFILRIPFTYFYIIKTEYGEYKLIKYYIDTILSVEELNAYNKEVDKFIAEEIKR